MGGRGRSTICLTTNSIVVATARATIGALAAHHVAAAQPEQRRCDHGDQSDDHGVTDVRAGTGHGDHAVASSVLECEPEEPIIDRKRPAGFSSVLADEHGAGASGHGYHAEGPG